MYKILALTFLSLIAYNSVAKAEKCDNILDAIELTGKYMPQYTAVVCMKSKIVYKVFVKESGDPLLTIIEEDKKIEPKKD